MNQINSTRSVMHVRLQGYMTLAFFIYVVPGGLQ